MAKKLAAIFALFDLWDFLAAIGVIVAARGVWLIYPPAAWVFCGLVLMLVAARSSAAS